MSVSCGSLKYLWTKGSCAYFVHICEEGSDAASEYQEEKV